MKQQVPLIDCLYGNRVKKDARSIRILPPYLQLVKEENMRSAPGHRREEPASLYHGDDLLPCMYGKM